MRRKSLGFLVCAACLSLTGNASVRADLITTVTPTVSYLGGPLYSYSYLVANSPSSTVGMAEFDLAVRPGVSLSSIVAPTGFLAVYSSGDSEIDFLSSDPSADVKVGSSGVFSFTADAGPAANFDLTRGFDTLTGAVFQNSGSTLTPTALPEPGVVVLSSLGGLAVLCRAAYRRRRAAKA